MPMVSCFAHVNAIVHSADEVFCCKTGYDGYHVCEVMEIASGLGCLGAGGRLLLARNYIVVGFASVPISNGPALPAA